MQNMQTPPVQSFQQAALVSAADTGMKSCQFCQAKIQLNAKFCASCGKQVEVPKTLCVACKAEIPENAKFCSSCGTAQISETTCSECQTVIKLPAKFCPGCGKAISN